MLLIGLDGTGKSTIMELAAFVSNCELIKLNLKKGYGYPDFRDDLKRIFRLVGVQKKRVVFFIADKDIYEVVFIFKKEVSIAKILGSYQSDLIWFSNRI